MAGRLNILLVQASESGTEAVRETLAACGCRVTEVGSYEEIASRLGQGPFDIVLLNLTDGALAWAGEGASLSELVPGASVVVLLAAFDSEQAMAAIQQGAQEVLVAAELTPTRLASALECAVMRARLSHIDNLTGLPNRALLHDRLAHAIDQARRYDERLAVMFVDLDRFKAINDTLGHASGDKMLRAVAERLTDCLRGSDTVARLGGDEFVAVLDKLPRDIVAAEVAQKVIARLSEPVSTSGVEMRVTPSIGIALFPTDGEDATELIRNADAAMYQAKERGGGSYVFYRPDMNAEDLRRMGLAFALRGGLQREEFELYYQPQIELATGRIVAVEALLRWRHPQRGLVSPEHFLPLARELGLMRHIGDWAIAESCRHLRTWRRAGRQPLRLALNLSPEQFWAEQLVAQVEAFIGEAGIDADDLTLEVSEGCVMRNAAAGLAVLQALRRLGVRLAIDDYGTAHASIADLHRFPVQALKIDRRFLDNVTTDADNNAIVRAVVALAGSLDLDLVAEGAETAEQVAFLRAQSCRFAQGYVFGRPVPEDQLFDLLTEVEDRWSPGNSARPARLGAA